MSHINDPSFYKLPYDIENSAYAGLNAFINSPSFQYAHKVSEQFQKFGTPKLVELANDIEKSVAEFKMAEFNANWNNLLSTISTQSAIIDDFNYSDTIAKCMQPYLDAVQQISEVTDIQNSLPAIETSLETVDRYIKAAAELSQVLEPMEDYIEINEGKIDNYNDISLEQQKHIYTQLNEILHNSVIFAALSVASDKINSLSDEAKFYILVSIACAIIGSITGSICTHYIDKKATEVQNEKIAEISQTLKDINAKMDSN